MLGTTAWAYQIAGAAALRIVNLLSVNPLPATGTLVPEAADIEIDDVCFSYGPTLALDHVSLRVPEGTYHCAGGSSALASPPWPHWLRALLTRTKAGSVLGV